MNIQCNTVAVLLIYTSRKNYEAEEFSSGASHKKRLRKGVAKSLEHFSPSNFSIGFNLFHRFHEIFGEFGIFSHSVGIFEFWHFRDSLIFKEDYKEFCTAISRRPYSSFLVTVRGY